MANNARCDFFKPRTSPLPLLFRRTKATGRCHTLHPRHFNSISENMKKTGTRTGDTSFVPLLRTLKRSPNHKPTLSPATCCLIPNPTLTTALHSARLCGRHNAADLNRSKPWSDRPLPFLPPCLPLIDALEVVPARQHVNARGPHEDDVPVLGHVRPPHVAERRARVHKPHVAQLLEHTDILLLRTREETKNERR